MTTDYQAFLGAIVAAPNDDAPRLAYADALELGDAGFPAEPARAEFIRLQCEITRIESTWLRGASGLPMPSGHPAWHARRDALLQRERELYDSSADWMLPHLPDVFAGVVIDLDELVVCGDAGQISNRAVGLVTRGFVSRLTLAWQDWTRHAVELLAACPIRRVNRPRDCIGCCGTGRAEAYATDECGQTRHLPEQQYDCPVCHGTGKVDDWQGDGLVRLTTWPEWQGELIVVGDTTEQHLQRRWPGVRFELPPDRGDFVVTTSGAFDGDTLEVACP